MYTRKEKATRAAWLYFSRGYTQDEVALQVGVSRAAAQRLIAHAVDEKLVSFKINCPIGSCMALGAALAERYGLSYCDISPSDPKTPEAREVIAPLIAERMLQLLSSEGPVTIGVGTGRTLRMAVEQLPRLSRPEHRIFSLVGTTSGDGRASFFDVVGLLADRIGSERYPLQMPVIAETASLRAALQQQPAYGRLLQMRTEADSIFIGIGEVGLASPLVEDGFLSAQEMSKLVAQGAVGEITGWAFDKEGRVLEGPMNDRVASMPLTSPPSQPVIIAGGGQAKIGPLRAALSGRLATALITDEQTAISLIDG